MHINAGALHYGVSVFEGLKAFACKDGKVRIMNPMMNAARMQEGADALLMPKVPKETFIAAVKEAVRRNIEFTPPYGHGASMYIRPLLFASGQMLGLAPLASEYTFFVTVMPAGGYFSKGAGETGVKAVVSVDHDRAAPKGTGGVKAAGNYAADLMPVHTAHKSGYNTTLYLDAKERKYIEEFSVCNFVGITHDNKYVTPKSETILASTTNKMMQQLAKDRGMTVENRPIDFEKEIGTFKEVGMCGTAAVVVKVQEIQHGDKLYEFDTFDTISSLRAELTGIQCGDVADKYGWMVEVGDVYDEAAPSFPALAIESAAPKMVDLEAKGTIQKQGREALHGSERKLLKYVVKHAEPGNPNSVLSAMDDFWNSTFQSEGRDKWKVRGLTIENKVLEKVAKKNAIQQPVRCLELGTYCGYSAIQIAKHLPEGSILLSVEQDELYAAIATKIIEFAGLESRVKIWMGTVHDEPANMLSILSNTAADFVLVDHSKERYVPDLKLLQEYGLVQDSTTVLGDLEVYPGDEFLPPVVEESIKEFFTDRAFKFATLV
jgi:branched-chain amino acid aminotransferase